MITKTVSFCVVIFTCLKTMQTTTKQEQFTYFTFQTNCRPIFIYLITDLSPHLMAGQSPYRNREPTLWLQKDIVWCTTRFYFRTIVVPYLCQWHASGCKIKSIFTCWWFSLMWQSRDVEKIEKQLNKDFENVCNWFNDNKLSIYFGDPLFYLQVCLKSKLQEN